MKNIVARKIGMTRIFDKDGKHISATLLKSEDCYITQIKTIEKDGYNAIQIGYGSLRHPKKPTEGHLKKANCSVRYFKEFKVDKVDNLKLGDKIEVDNFMVGDLVEITSKSKGKGFQGVIKRYGFSRGPETHGSDHHRAPGSIGSAFPQRVFKGKKLPGRLGGYRRTIKKISVLDIVKDKNLILLKGSIPGANKSIVVLKGEDL